LYRADDKLVVDVNTRKSVKPCWCISC